MVTFDSEALEDLWITADYFPEMLNLQRPSGASSRDLAAGAASGRSATGTCAKSPSWTSAYGSSSLVPRQ